MELFLASFVVIALAILGMAVSVICGRRSIKGSCGGPRGAGGGCESCAGSDEEGKRDGQAARLSRSRSISREAP